MLQGSCPSRTAPDFVLERTKSGDVRKMPQFTHVMWMLPFIKHYYSAIHFSTVRV